MKILTFEEFMGILEKENNNIKEYPREYWRNYCFFILSDRKIQIMPKISTIPSYNEQPFNGDKEIKKHISKVASNMEICIQLDNIIKSLDHIKNELLNDEYEPHLEMIFAGCVATFFSFFKESKGFNKIGKDDDFYKFEIIDKNIISKEELKEIFDVLEKLRDCFYCHKQSAVGYNILSMLFEDDRIQVHTEEKTIPFFMYSDMVDVVEKFIKLAKHTLTYVKDTRIKEAGNDLNNCLNKKGYKEKLMNLIKEYGNDEIEHSRKIQEKLKSLYLKDRIDIQGNNLVDSK